VHWSFEQHLTRMASDGVVPAPRTGEGTPSSPWRDATGAPRRDAARERLWADRYLESLPRESRDLLVTLTEPLAPMDPACRAATLVPCRNEAPHVERLLSFLTDQRALGGSRLDPRTYEVHLLLNRYADEPEDDSEERIARWRCTRPGRSANLHVTRIVHPADEHAPLTRARKVLADLALWRARARQAWVAPLYLACQDADLLWVDPRELALTIDRLDRDPGLDGLRGQQDRCPWILVRHPLVLIMRRSWNFVETFMARRSLRPERNPRFDFNWNRLVTSGWSCGFTAEVYARIGGYTPERRFEEDMDIGEKISSLRAFESDGVLLPQVNTIGHLPSRAEGSPRRWLLWAMTDLQPYDDSEDYDNFFRRDHERKLKDTTLEELEAEVRDVTSLDDEGALGRLTRTLQADLDFVVRTLGAPLGGAAYSRVLAALGFERDDYDVVDGRLSLRSAAGPASRVRAFAERLGDRTPGEYPAPLAPMRGASTWRSFARRMAD
jgi:hypothetical protein